MQLSARSVFFLSWKTLIQVVCDTGCRFGDAFTRGVTNHVDGESKNTTQATKLTMNFSLNCGQLLRRLSGYFQQCNRSFFVLLLLNTIQVVPGQAGGGSFQKNKPIGNGHVAGWFAELRCSLTKQVGTDQWSESEATTVNCLAGKNVVHAFLQNTE